MLLIQTTSFITCSILLQSRSWLILCVSEWVRVSERELKSSAFTASAFHHIQKMMKKRNKKQFQFIPIKRIKWVSKRDRWMVEKFSTRFDEQSIHIFWYGSAFSDDLFVKLIQKKGERKIWRISGCNDRMKFSDDENFLLNIFSSENPHQAESKHS